MLKRKDDIRRRLTIAEVPKPPVDLVHRLKRDIPKHYTSKTAKQVEHKDREPLPLWNFWGFSWQLAAGVLILVGMTWAVFQTWESELRETTKISEADTGVMSVEKFEESVTGAPAVDEAAPRAQSAPEAIGSATRQQAEALRPAPPEAPPPLEAKAGEFAPEPPPAESGRRGRTASENVQRANPEERETSSERAVRPDKKDTGTTALAGASPTADDDRAVSAPAATRTAAKAVSRTEAKGEPAAAPPLFRTSSFADAGEDRLEVAVKDLQLERIVRVRVRVDAAGSVVEATILEEDDAAVLEAVRAAAAEWRFTLTEDDRAGSLTRTIEIRLRRTP